MMPRDSCEFQKNLGFGNETPVYIYTRRLKIGIESQVACQIMPGIFTKHLILIVLRMLLYTDPKNNVVPSKKYGVISACYKKFPAKNDKVRRIRSSYVIRDSLARIFASFSLLPLLLKKRRR